MSESLREGKQLYLDETVLVTGYAPSPHGTAMHSLYKFAGVVLEIDTQTDRIVNAEFTFVTSLARDFIARLIQGYNLNDGLEGLFQKIALLGPIHPGSQRLY